MKLIIVVIDDKPKVQVINKQELIEKKLKGEIEDDQTWVDVGVVNIVRNTEDESSEEESSSVEEPGMFLFAKMYCILTNGL